MRFIPHTEEDKKNMLDAIGAKSIEELFDDIPENIKLKRDLNLPMPLAELELKKHLKELGEKNITTEDYLSFLGAGAYEHFIPSVVNHVIGRSEFYTAYTPYQPEISQGILQAIFEYQTMICELTCMDAANASMYDGASALAEAAIMACQATKRSEIIIPTCVHPEYRQVVKTYSTQQGIKVVESEYSNGVTSVENVEKLLGDDTAGVIIQNPNFFGNIEDLEEISNIVKQNKSVFIVAADPISLGILKPPGYFGADIVVGEGQSMGNPLNFGGPYLGFMAVSKKMLRKIPGRIVGETKDSEGNRGFVLTLQAREQHIRREKATSNICSNEALCALAATVYLTYMGKQGLAEVAEQCVQKANYAYKNIIELKGFYPAFEGVPFFKEFVVKTDKKPSEINSELLKHGIIGGLDLGKYYQELENHVLICVTETKTKKDIDLFIERLGEVS
ncbi:MAG: glycine dehydrogenase subunit 1 [Thermosediminibacterales bacterium]|nr:glycine dehydrogenase subunit 1 [Thermosediminibacterales bacterium]